MYEYMTINMGDVVEFYMDGEMIDGQYHKKVLETGIVVYKENDLNYQTVYAISIKRYGGDYTVMEEDKIKKKCIPIEYKLSLVSSFGDWWFNHHKLLYQSILIEGLN